MAKGKRHKVARQHMYRTGWGDDENDGGVGVREPRRPLPPSPVTSTGARALPESIITAKLPDPPVR
ncbi:hypothetical protein [Allokutzneria oryzae]|uniref:Uncharacterized protein n=1 Tax=Allokutzneria oryzae TaxID=1378989 RepID=A0ABV6A161_9PSEU